MSFAHLLGLAKRAAKASDDDDDQARRAEGPLDDDPADQQNAKGRKAEGDDDDDLNPEGEDDDAEPKGKKAKGKKADDDEKPDESAEEDDDDAPKAVRADRQRCAAIMAFGLAHGCAEQAGVLAFETNMGKKAALNVLKAGGSRSTQAPAASLGNRMSKLNHAQVGPEGGGGQLPPGMSTIAAGIIKAGQ
jgi:hypothetical protein